MRFDTDVSVYVTGSDGEAWRNFVIELSHFIYSTGKCTKCLGLVS